MKPKSRTDSAITQIAAGGLSTVIELARRGAEEDAVQLWAPACAAAA